MVFDAYGTLFDVYSVTARCESCWPGKGEHIAHRWRAKQLEYTWVRSLSKRYAPFSTVTREALAYTCESLGVELWGAQLEKVMDEYFRLKTFMDVHAVQEYAGKKAILSNGSPDMLLPLVAQSGLRFDAVISVDEVKVFKPDPQTYQLAVDHLKLPKEKIGFVSSNCWDALGARAFGFTAYWIKRGPAPMDRLGLQPSAVLSSLHEVLQ